MPGERSLRPPSAGRYHLLVTVQPSMDTSDDRWRQEDIAWVAGVFEGEGTIYFNKRGYSVHTSIRMDDRDVVERIHAIMGFGKFSQRSELRTSGKTVIQYNYQVSTAKDVIVFLEAILPYLGLRRRERALQAIARARLVGSFRYRPWTPERRARHMEAIARRRAA